jgi:hypothetical protein
MTKIFTNATEEVWARGGHHVLALCGYGKISSMGHNRKDHGRISFFNFTAGRGANQSIPRQWQLP